GGHQRQPQRELAAVPEPVARGHDRATVQLDELAAQCEPDAEPAATDERAVLGHLAEHLEDLRQALGRDAEAAVGDMDERLVALECGTYRDLAVRVTVLRGVREQIHEHLSQALEIAVRAQRLVAELDAEAVPARRDQRLALLYRALER